MPAGMLLIDDVGRHKRDLGRRPHRLHDEDDQP